MAWIHILFDPRDFELPIKQIMMIGSREAQENFGENNVNTC